MSCAPQNYLMPKTTEQQFPACQRKKKPMIKKCRLASFAMPILKGASFWIRSWEHVTTVSFRAAFPKVFSPNPADLRFSVSLCVRPSWAIILICQSWASFPFILVSLHFQPAVSLPSEHTYLNVAFAKKPCCLYLGFPRYALKLPCAEFGADTSSHLFVLLVRKTHLDSISVLLTLYLVLSCSYW